MESVSNRDAMNHDHGDNHGNDHGDDQREVCFSATC